MIKFKLKKNKNIFEIEFSVFPAYLSCSDFALGRESKWNFLIKLKFSCLNFTLKTFPLIFTKLESILPNKQTRVL